MIFYLNFDFYKEAMKDELETFVAAFAAKYRLFPPPGKDQKPSMENLPEVDKRRLMRAAHMAQAMEERTLRKRMEG